MWVLLTQSGLVPLPKCYAGRASNTYKGEVEQILLGKAAAGKIPIETLQRFTLVINMKSAIQLGVYPPLDLIKIAELL